MATRRETQIPFGNDNKNKDSASEEKAVRARAVFLKEWLRAARRERRFPSGMTTKE
jgi:hypothetical protein